MNLFQRTLHSYIWKGIAVVLGLGFVGAGWAAFRNPYTKMNASTVPYKQDQILDSLYVDSMDTRFWLKKNEDEQYLEAQVLSERAMLSSQVFQGEKSLGIIRGKGIYILRSGGDSIGTLRFKKLLSF